MLSPRGLNQSLTHLTDCPCNFHNKEEAGTVAGTVAAAAAAAVAGIIVCYAMVWIARP